MLAKKIILNKVDENYDLIEQKKYIKDWIDTNEWK